MIVCPNCTTSYDVDPAKLGPKGRTVRCSRCKESWLALPADEMSMAMAAEAGPDAAPSHADEQDWQTSDAPVIDSPSISIAVDADKDRGLDVHPDWQAMDEEPKPAGRIGRLLAALKIPVNLPPLPRVPVPQFMRHYWTLPAACAGMAALAIALVVWRADVVRLMPQTAAFFKMTGLEVNLRGLKIENVKVTSETVDGKPVLVIEGFVAEAARKSAQAPRLRFVVLDEKGVEIYAWNSVIEQTVLQPGERVSFRSRLASPPADARTIAVRFFNRRDIGA
jgi:predicted Zn finger-like uncharacterized protein